MLNMPIVVADLTQYIGKRVSSVGRETLSRLSWLWACLLPMRNLLIGLIKVGKPTLNVGVFPISVLHNLLLSALDYECSKTNCFKFLPPTCPQQDWLQLVIVIQINPFSFRLLWSGCFLSRQHPQKGIVCHTFSHILGSESDIALRFWWLFYIKSLMEKQSFLMRLLNSLNVSSWNIHSVLDPRTQANTVEGRFSRSAWPGYQGEKLSLQAQEYKRTANGLLMESLVS